MELLRGVGNSFREFWEDLVLFEIEFTSFEIRRKLRSELDSTLNDVIVLGRYSITILMKLLH